MAIGIARTSNFVNDTTTRGIHMTIYQAWTERSQVGRQIFNVHDSNQIREHNLTFGGIGTMDEKAEGEDVNYTTPVEGYLKTFTHTVFAKGIRITAEQWSDDLYGVMEDSPAELGMAAYATEEGVLANHFNNGFGTATTPDGQPIFDTAHVRENLQTYKNELTTAASLSTTSLEQMVIDFRNFRSGGGRRLAIRPKCLLVPPDLIFDAKRILNSTQTPEDDTNAVQPLNDSGLELKVWDYLTDTNAFFLLADKSDHEMHLYEREAFTSSDVVDFDSGDLKFKGLFRQSSGVSDPRGIFGSPGA